MAFKTPDLPYAYDALEPWIDTATMQVHHDKHHVTYTTKLNAAVEGTEYAGWSAEDLVKKLASLPASIKGAVQNNGGGHINHELFWNIMAPAGKGGGGEPDGDLGKEIAATFGSFADFVTAFSNAAVGRFGSGWAWLVLASGKLEIVTTANQDNPITDGKSPILGLDVWEHAYYLKYQNRRPEYIENWFKVVNWSAVAKLYAAAK